jgi:predicted phage terminase large subunit-like protein
MNQSLKEWMMTNLTNIEDPKQFLKTLQRRDFIAFLDRVWPHVCGGQTLIQNWHIQAIANRLEAIENGTSRRLIVNLPPRNGKSIIISVAWIAWMLGQDPSLSFVCVSYSNELSSKLARDCLSVMQSNWYRELFTKTVVSQRRSASYDFETTRGGGRLSTSVAGTLTGRGGDILVLDDVIKPEDAHSEVIRAAVNEWYRSTLVSRLNDKSSGAIICVMQRLHEFDLSGMLLESGDWSHLALPSISTEKSRIPLLRGQTHLRDVGDILHAEREPLEVLNELKKAMGSAAFAAQYQQDPIPVEGNVFKAKWLRTSNEDYTTTARGQIIQSWDTGIKTGQHNDWSACITAVLNGKDLHIINVWRGRLEFPELKKKAIELAGKFRPDTLLIEDKASGQQLIQTLRSEEPACVPRPIARTPEVDKISRAQGVSSMIEAGQLFLSEEAPWLAEFKSELLAFPNGRFDDQVDALTQLLAWTRDRVMDAPTPLAGPILSSEDHDDYAMAENRGLIRNEQLDLKSITDAWL